MVTSFAPLLLTLLIGSLTAGESSAHVLRMAEAPGPRLRVQAPRTVQLTPSAQSVRQKASKIPFPLEYRPNQSEPYALTGTALRTKTIFGVKVYAYGVYVPRSSLKSRLAAWKGKSTKALRGDDKLYRALLEDEQPKILRLVFARNVDADDVRDAFVKSLEPRLASAKKKGRGDGSPALKSFRSFFSLDKLQKGAELLFLWDGSALHTWVNGELQKPLASAPLAGALFDVYLGSKPIMKNGKRDLVDRLELLLEP